MLECHYKKSSGSTEEKLNECLTRTPCLFATHRRIGIRFNGYPMHVMREKGNTGVKEKRAKSSFLLSKDCGDKDQGREMMQA